MTSDSARLEYARIPLVLATDLDGTFLGGSETARRRLYSWIEANRDEVGLIFVTGRDPGFIRDLNAAGFAALDHRVWLHAELSGPLMLAAMVLLGAGLSMRHTRFGRTGVMVLGAILSGLGVFFIRNFAHVLGETALLPVALVAWTPPIAAILLALTLMLHWEDG